MGEDSKLIIHVIALQLTQSVWLWCTITDKQTSGRTHNLW